jgi:hypothetical protein
MDGTLIFMKYKNKLVEGSSGKANRKLSSNKVNVILKVFFCLFLTFPQCSKINSCSTKDSFVN